jgi:tetratricopeptide (TPR) repeat protein
MLGLLNMTAPLDDLRGRTRTVLDKLQGIHDEQDVVTARGLLKELRDQCEYERLIAVAEALGRIDSKHELTRRLYAQALIETGKVTAAIDMLQALAKRLPGDHPESLEAMGLLGRAYKQIFFDSRDRTSQAAREALKQAITAYRKPYEANPANTWHGVNLLALITNCRRLGIPLAAGLESRALATQLLATLREIPQDKRDEWYLPTLAEVTLGTQDRGLIEGTLREYAGSPDVQAFQLRSTLRQFTTIWNVEDDERGRAMVNILRARLMQLPGGSLELSPQDVRQLRDQPAPDRSQLEALLGTEGPKTYRWWQTGLTRALSVAAVHRKLSGRIGTGFLVRARDFNLSPPDELLLLTNFHVVNPEGIAPGIRPEQAEVVFEAHDPNRSYNVAEIVWKSPIEKCDASLLRLEGGVAGIEPIPVAGVLPAIEATARVYIVGHPGGRDLAFSFQDNELLDHEGPPAGRPQIADVCRVHYRAPTEGGSSGSPVFNGDLWQVIALHHRGGTAAMPKLNGASGTYAANEGIWIQSIISAMNAGH